MIVCSTMALRSIVRLRLIQICELHFDDFSLYFLQSLSSEEVASLPAPDSPLAYTNMKRSWAPVLELTHNHGTEKDPEFAYHDGNTGPKVRDPFFF